MVPTIFVLFSFLLVQIGCGTSPSERRTLVANDVDSISVTDIGRQTVRGEKPTHEEDLAEEVSLEEQGGADDDHDAPSAVLREERKSVRLATPHQAPSQHAASSEAHLAEDVSPHHNVLHSDGAMRPTSPQESATPAVLREEKKAVRASTPHMVVTVDAEGEAAPAELHAQDAKAVDAHHQSTAQPAGRIVSPAKLHMQDAKATDSHPQAAFAKGVGVRLHAKHSIDAHGQAAPIPEHAQAATVLEHGKAVSAASSTSSSMTMTDKHTASGADQPTALDEPDAEGSEDEDDEKSITVSRILDGLSGGTGTGDLPTGNKKFDRTIKFRMRAQDSAVLILLMVVYFVLLGLMVSLVWRSSATQSDIRYYCDPSQHRLNCTCADKAGFLATFNKRPESNKPQILVAGFEENAAPTEDDTTDWRGKKYGTVFYYALDLDSWTEEMGEMDEEGRDAVDDFLASKNSLATLSIKKEIVWDHFEDVCTHLKAKIRACGFDGPLDISISPPDKLRVYQNTHWANFMFNETMKVIALLSIIGGLFYLPYMWIRAHRARKVVTSRFRITIDGTAYWRLIGPYISEKGFCVPDDQEGPQVLPAPERAEEENAMPANFEAEAAVIMNI